MLSAPEVERTHVALSEVQDLLAAEPLSYCEYATILEVFAYKW